VAVHLAELLVALAMVGALMAATFTTLDAAQRAYAIGAGRAESQQNGRVALERLARDVRHAGYGPTSEFDAVLIADSTRLVVQSDFNGDGIIGGAGETITWRLTGATLRRDAGGGAQPIIDGVRAFVLEYLDAADAPTAVSADVRTVVVTLVTQPPASRFVPAGAVTFTTAARIRNR
jgi:type IV pilus assembly protein PilW